VSANALLAVNSAKDAHTAAGKLVGGLLSNTLDVHKNAGSILVDIVSAINSLNIAGLNLAAGVTNSALSALVGKIRWVAAQSYGTTQLLDSIGVQAAKEWCVQSSCGTWHDGCDCQLPSCNFKSAVLNPSSFTGP